MPAVGSALDGFTVNQHVQRQGPCNASVLKRRVRLLSGWPIASHWLRRRVQARPAGAPCVGRWGFDILLPRHARSSSTNRGTGSEARADVVRVDLVWQLGTAMGVNCTALWVD